MIKNILFDLGGVFIEHTREVCVRRFEELGIHDADQMLDPYLQSGIFLDLERGVHTEESFTAELNRLYDVQLTPDQVRHAIHGFVNKVQDYKFDYLEEGLPEDIRLLLISNTNPFIWKMATEGQLLDNHRSLESYFDICYKSYEMKMCKPEKEIFKSIIKDSGIEASETLFIDDGPANTRMARTLGFVTYCPDNGEDWRPVLDKMLNR